MSLTTLLRSSGSMNNRSLIIIHSLKHSAHDFWTEASDCTYCLCTTLSTDTLLLTISLKLQLYCRIQNNTFCPRHDMLRPYWIPHTRQQSVESWVTHFRTNFIIRQQISPETGRHSQSIGSAYQWVLYGKFQILRTPLFHAWLVYQLPASQIP